MNPRNVRPLALALVLFGGCQLLGANSPPAWEVAPTPDFREVISRTEQMVSDPQAQALARRHDLQIVNVTWEDTGRYKGSSVGPNISDMTIQVQEQDPQRAGGIHLMPVIRHPNFSDRTADISPDQFWLLVGNERGDSLQRVTLTDFLADLRRYLTDGESWAGSHRSLLAPRDSHVLVSAQACFLPISQGADTAFNPVLFNYQSYSGDPAVLTILATREGTSVTVIDNQRDGFSAGRSWGQRLFFNQSGERASLTGSRESDFIATSTDPGELVDSTRAGGGTGLNMVLLIQVPLIQKRPMSFFMDAEAAMPGMSVQKGARSDVEDAVIGHGDVEGPFTEIGGLDIQRDPKFPIRVTVQFYKATSNGMVNESDLKEIAGRIERVYEDSDYVGSLVVGGETGRPTEHDGDEDEPANWWSRFWRRHWGN